MRRAWIGSLVVTAIIACLGCATGQLRQIDDQVKVLDERLNILDQNYTRTADASEQNLQQLYSGLKKQNESIQTNQTKLNTVLEDLSGQVLKMKGQLDGLSQKVSELETRIGTTETTMKADSEAVRNELKAGQQANDTKIAQNQSALETKLAQAIDASEGRTKKSVTDLRTEMAANLKQLEKLLTGIGGESASSGSSGSSGSAGSAGGGSSAPSKPSSAPPAKKAEGSLHRVAAGESLSKIAQKWGVSKDDIIKANNIKDPGKINEGDELIIPGK